MWNDAYIELKNRVGEENCTWFRGSWLFAECYLYRRMRECMLLCSTQQMKDYDPFEMAKWETNEMSKSSVHSLIKSLCPLDMQDEASNEDVQKERFRVIIEVNLALNKTSGPNNNFYIRNILIFKQIY